MSYSVEAIPWKGVDKLSPCKYGLWFFVTNPANKYGFYVERPWLIPHSDWLELLKAECTVRTGSSVIAKSGQFIKFNGLHEDAAHTVFMCEANAFSESLKKCVDMLSNKGLLL